MNDPTFSSIQELGITNVCHQCRRFEMSPTEEAVAG